MAPAADGDGTQTGAWYRTNMIHTIESQAERSSALDYFFEGLGWTTLFGRMAREQFLAPSTLCGSYALAKFHRNSFIARDGAGRGRWLGTGWPQRSWGT